ncbi:MAG: hypothetical protein ACLP78_03705 [Thermoplasmata archaeon]
MATHRPARGVGQRQLEGGPEEADPDLPPESTPDPPSPALPPAPPLVEDLPGGAGAALRERQRRWLAERARFEESVRAAAADVGAAPPSG